MKERENTEIFGSFFLNENEFAIRVTHVQEVVNPPEKITGIPLAPDYFRGVFNLRGAIIPVVDLKAILGMKIESPTTDSGKIAIIDQDGTKIGLLFDRTGEIFRSQPDEMSEFQYADSTAKANVVSAAIKLDDGKRIIQVLDVKALVKLECVPHSATNSSTEREQKKKNQGSRRQCISFVVGKNRCAFGIDVIHEIIKVPALKESILGSSLCVGIIDLRGDVVPVVDFAVLLKYRTPGDRPPAGEDQRVLVLEVQGQKLGLLIDSVDSIVTYYTDELLYLPILSKEKSSMFVGCLTNAGNVDIIVLNHDEILTSPELSEITQGHSKIFQSSSKRGVDEKKKKSDRKTYITFQIENLLGLGIDEVREIIDFPEEILHPPGLPEFVRGIFNLRGQMVTILDVRSLYSAEKKTQTAQAKVVIFKLNEVNYGLIVDSVEDIISISEDQTLKLPDIYYKEPGVKGIADDIKFAVEIKVRDEKKTMMVLNLVPLTERVGLSKPALRTA